MRRFVAMSMAALLLAGCATIPEPSESRHPRDPWESYNRAVFQFNRKVDKYVWRPPARVYEKITPSPVKQGINNFFTNLGYPVDIVNLLFQGKVEDTGIALGRFVMNTTIGMGGLFDVATKTGIPHYEEDFGQTLAVWGWTDTNYFVVPFFGGTTIADTVGYVPDVYFNLGWQQFDHDETAYALGALNLIQLRAQLLSQDQTVADSYDKYKLFRDSYLQRRDYLIRDGKTDLPDYDQLLEEE